jgi:hypothetical protein
MNPLLLLRKQKEEDLDVSVSLIKRFLGERSIFYSQQQGITADETFTETL